MPNQLLGHKKKRHDTVPVLRLFAEGALAAGWTGGGVTGLPGRAVICRIGRNCSRFSVTFCGQNGRRHWKNALWRTRNVRKRPFRTPGPPCFAFAHKNRAKKCVRSDEAHQTVRRGRRSGWEQALADRARQAAQDRFRGLSSGEGWAA